MLKTTLKGLLNQYPYSTVIKILEECARESANNAAEDGRFTSEAFFLRIANDLETVGQGNKEVKTYIKEREIEEQ